MSDRTFTRVRELMRPTPSLIDGLATVQDALDVMRRENVGALVIDRRHEGDEYGIIVLSDIAAKVIAENRSPERINVYEVMSKPVVTVVSFLKTPSGTGCRPVGAFETTAEEEIDSR